MSNEPRDTIAQALYHGQDVPWSILAKPIKNYWRSYADAVLAALRDSDALWDRIDDAIETAVWTHERQDGDGQCQCGAVNNMDGDILPCHRAGAVMQAVRAAFFGEAS